MSAPKTPLPTSFEQSPNSTLTPDERLFDHSIFRAILLDSLDRKNREPSEKGEDGCSPPPIRTFQKIRTPRQSLSRTLPGPGVRVPVSLRAEPRDANGTVPRGPRRACRRRIISRVEKLNNSTISSSPGREGARLSPERRNPISGRLNIGMTVLTSGGLFWVFT